jgi:hypothetical protein
MHRGIAGDNAGRDSRRNRLTRRATEWYGQWSPAEFDEIVFGQPNDLVQLGARSLEGMNLKVDLTGKRLVAGGPMMAAAA